jgi:hypothetical protein
MLKFVILISSVSFCCNANSVKLKFAIYDDKSMYL